MPHSFEMEKIAAFMIPLGSKPRVESLSVKPLRDENEREVLEFLYAAHSVQSTFMAGLVRDNGLESPFNRGIFYGACKGLDRALAGVALIGHATLVETTHDSVLEAFARVAEACPDTHVHLGEEEKIKRFWRYYSRGHMRPSLICREMLFELREPAKTTEIAEGLRLATLDDLPFVMSVQACMALEESGVNPLSIDPVGFRLRCARRIEQGRVWVWIEDGRLLFKADILADTREAIYLEGVYASQSARYQGCGLRCLAQMSRMLLERTRALQLLVNEQNRKAQAFYLRAGFNFGGYYDTIFLQSSYEVKD